MTGGERGWDRVTLPGSGEDRLFFAQVREDPLLEIEALAPAPGETVVVVSSGGCTALSLLAAGAGRVVAVDLNTAQNHVVELKAEALARLPAGEVVAFLGAAPGSDRWSTYLGLREALSPATQAYWDDRRRTIEKGLLAAGVSERFIGLVIAVMKAGIHGRRRIGRLLACRTLDEQRALYGREWDNRRWRLLFSALLNRAVFRKTYDPAFFAHVENPSFARHFHGLVEHGLTEVPVRDNYFLHQMLTGRYPIDVDNGVPPYLAESSTGALTGLRDRLTLVDAAYGDYLATCEDGSIHGFALSNIAEWLDAGQLDALFAEIVRTAAPGARLVFRNFVGWTEVPERWRDRVVEDRARGEALILRDRSLLQRRIAVCTIADAA